MKTKNLHVLALLICLAINGLSQAPIKPDAANAGDTTTVNSLLQKSKASFGSPDSAILFAVEAKDLAEKINFSVGKALAYKNMGLAYYYKGDYVASIEKFQESLKTYEELKDETGVANILNNMAAIYGEQGNEEKGLEFSLRSLSISEKLGNKLRILSALNTIGTIYFNKEDTKSKALEYLLRALPLCEEINDSAAIGTISENIGEIFQEKDSFAKAVSYFEKSIKALGNTANSSFAYNGIGKVYQKQGKYDEALKYHNIGLTIAEDLGSKPNMVRSLYGLGKTYFLKKEYSTSIKYYQRAGTIAEEINAAPELKDIYQDMATTYSVIGDYKNAYTFKARYADVKDTLYNTETSKKLVGFQLAHDLEKKESEISLLTKDKDLQAVKLKRQQFAKNAFLIGLVLAFTIALLILRNYLIKVKTHKILDRQKNEIEGLLLNILPKEVANELQVNGHATPRHYDSVSVMFTDFKSFTIIADNMSPDELVAELDACFIAFDGIIEKYGLEKIKTIGDSYMCAGGIPTHDDQHVLKMVKAGLEIQDYVAQNNERRENKGQAPWSIRIGIHVGPIVAGVVGKKKYAYDIWGSTVNIASRMESNGEPGRVNISHATYEMIKEHYVCSHRGKISAKNIGEVDMYFIEHETNGKLKLTQTEELQAN